MTCGRRSGRWVEEGLLSLLFISLEDTACGGCSVGGASSSYEVEG